MSVTTRQQPTTKEGQEVIRVSTRAEIRYMHLVEGVAKKEVARRLGVDVKTVRRHIQGPDEYPARRSPRRGRALDAHRDEIVALLELDRRISAKRIGRLLEEKHGLFLNERTIRRFVQEVRGSVTSPEPFVHRTHVPGETMEIDFGESWAELAGCRTKIFFFVATLPASNAYFAKAYRFQRVECLLDGITSAIEWFGGLPARVVFDNASTAVKKILKGAERIENERFHEYRAEWPLGADFCNPASGWEKGSAERGVDYVRGMCLRPVPVVDGLDELNGHILHELDVDLDRRKLRDGRTAREALAEERAHLRAIPVHRPDTARIVSCSADKYAHVRVDRSSYSIPSRLARRQTTVRLYHDRVEIACDGYVVAVHERSTMPGEYVLELEHVLEVLERKPRAAVEATAIRQLGLPPCFEDLRVALRRDRRHSDREWVQILGLLVDHSLGSVSAAVEKALESEAPGIGSVRQLLRCESQPRVAIEPISLERPKLARIEVAMPDLGAWDVLHTGVIA